MIRYKIDILAALKEKGYTTYKISNNRIFSNSTVQKFRTGEIVNDKNLNKLCQLLLLQPGDILEYIPD